MNIQLERLVTVQDLRKQDNVMNNENNTFNRNDIDRKNEIRQNTILRLKRNRFSWIHSRHGTYFRLCWKGWRLTRFHFISIIISIAHPTYFIHESACRWILWYTRDAFIARISETVELLIEKNNKSYNTGDFGSTDTEMRVMPYANV